VSLIDRITANSFYLLAVVVAGFLSYLVVQIQIDSEDRTDAAKAITENCEPTEYFVVGDSRSKNRISIVYKCEGARVIYE
jgi:hypothetical protein